MKIRTSTIFVAAIGFAVTGACTFGCASPSAEKREQVRTAQDQMFGPSDSRRLQRRNNVENR